MIKYINNLIGRINFGRNTTPKLVSILFAIVLYIFVMGEINPEEKVEYNNVPVQLLNVDELERDGLLLIDQKDYKVQVSVVGTRNDLAQLSSDAIHVSADLRGYKEGVSSIPLDVSELSDDIKISVSPAQIKVRLDEIVQRSKAVEIISKGKPTQEFIASSVVANPAEIIVEGSKSKVETVDKIVGEIDITDLQADVNKDVAIKAIDSEGNDVIGVDLKTSKVNVDVVIDKTKNIEIEVPVVGSVKRGYKLVSVNPAPKRIFIKGKDDIIKDLKVVLTEPINIEGLNKTVSVTAKLNLPEGIMPVYLTDDIKIEIQVEKIETKEFNYKARQVLINNLDDELTTNISSNDSDIKVIISDVRSVLDKVTWADLQLVINAKDLPEGNYDLKPNLLNADNYIKVDIVPVSINVDVKSKTASAATEVTEPPANDTTTEPTTDNSSEPEPVDNTSEEANQTSDDSDDSKNDEQSSRGEAEIETKKNDEQLKEN